MPSIFIFPCLLCTFFYTVHCIALPPRPLLCSEAVERLATEMDLFVDVMHSVVLACDEDDGEYNSDRCQRTCDSIGQPLSLRRADNVCNFEDNVHEFATEQKVLLPLLKETLRVITYEASTTGGLVATTRLGGGGDALDEVLKEWEAARTLSKTLLAKVDKAERLSR